MDKNNEYVTLADCLVFCNILDYKISERQLRRIIDTEDIETFKSNKILVNKKQFSNLILEKYRKKSKKAIKKRDVKVVDKVNDNLFIGLDWFQCTFYAMRKSYFEKRDVINMFSTLLRINENDIVYSEKRFYNYKFCLEYKGINLFFGDESYNHCNLQITGEGCRLLDELLFEKEEDYFDFFDTVITYKGKITRLDIAIDDFSPLFELEELEKKIREHNELIVTKFQSFNFMHETKNGVSKGMTIYCGSKKSNLFLRFYKKGIQLQQENEEIDLNFNRFEIVMRDDKANSFFKQISKSKRLKEKSVSVLNSYFSVFETEEKLKYWDKWEQLIQGSMKFKFENVKKQKTIERKKSFLITQASTSLALVLQADQEAKEKGLLNKDYDTIGEIVSFAKINEKEKEKLIEDYINKKQKVIENLY